MLATADIPDWALTSLDRGRRRSAPFVFLLAFFSARRHHRSVLEEAGTLKRVVTMARYGLGVMHEPLPAAGAIFFQCLGWLCQFFAVYTAMQGFDIHVPLPAAGLVLVLMNVATIFPLWPGNVGLTQAAIALPLVQYGVPYAKGFAFGIGLQAIEASVGIGVGLFFLGREGLSFAMLRKMPEVTEAEFPDSENGERSSPRVKLLASPASLKGVLSAVDAAAALVEGAGAGAEAALPIADGGGGTAEVLAAARGGSWHEAVVSDPLGRPVSARWLMLPDRTAVVEAAAADRAGAARRGRAGPDACFEPRARRAGPGRARGGPDALLVCLATRRRSTGGRVHGGARRLSRSRFAPPATCAIRCSARAAPRAPSGRRRAPRLKQVEELEARLAAREACAVVASLPGAGAAGGLGAALAALGAELVSGAALVLELDRFS